MNLLRRQIEHVGGILLAGSLEQRANPATSHEALLAHTLRIAKALDLSSEDAIIHVKLADDQSGSAVRVEVMARSAAPGTPKLVALGADGRAEAELAYCYNDAGGCVNHACVASGPNGLGAVFHIWPKNAGPAEGASGLVNYNLDLLSELFTLRYSSPNLNGHGLPRELLPKPDLLGPRQLLPSNRSGSVVEASDVQSSAANTSPVREMPVLHRS
jgi:hypothetical protein